MARPLAIIGLMTAILCVLGPLTIPIPFSPVPISLCTLGICFASIVLGAKRGTLSVLLYLLLGLAGLPVFSGFMGGPAKMFGPTGGYLLGYLFMAPICGLSFVIFKERFWLRLLGMGLGNALCYTFGSLWLAYQLSLSVEEAFLIGVVPYLPGDMIKLFIANTAGIKLQKTLTKSNLIS